MQQNCTKCARELQIARFLQFSRNSQAYYLWKFRGRIPVFAWQISCHVCSRTARRGGREPSKHWQRRISSWVADSILGRDVCDTRQSGNQVADRKRSRQSLCRALHSSVAFCDGWRVEDVANGCRKLRGRKKAEQKNARDQHG